MVKSRRRPVVAAFVVWLGLMAAAAGTAPASAEVATISVSVDTPAAGATVSGPAVKVTYTVTGANGVVIGWTGVNFAGRHQSRYVGTTCDLGCTLTATFDTTTVPSAPTASGAADYADGPQTVRVNASTTSGDSASDEVGVIVDNQRPTEKLGAPRPDPRTTSTYQYTATDRLHLEAYPTVRDGGSTASMTFHYFENGVRTTTPFSAPSSPEGAWTLDLDTSRWSGGTGSAWVSTTDDRGVRSIGTMVYYVVDRGMTLTGPELPETVDDFTIDAVKLQYSFPDRYVATFPVHVATYLDGLLVEEHPLIGVYTGDPPGVVTARSGGRTPPGVHDVRYVVTDNRGVSAEVSYRLTVNKTLDIAWTSGPGATVLPGPLELAGTADSVRTPITASTFYIDDTVLDFWRCTTSECPYHLDAVGKGQPHPEVYTPGVHRIRWEVGTREGLPKTVTGTVTVLPYASASVTKRGPATYGRDFDLTGQVSQTGGEAAAGATVRLQRQPADNSGPWTTVATSQADHAGTVDFTVRAVRSSQYRMITVTDPTRWAGELGTARTITSYADLRLTRRPTAGAVGRAVAIRGTVAPAKPGQDLYVQERRGGRWVEVAGTRPLSDGSFAVRYRVPRKGKIQLRVVRPHSAGLLTTRTASWSITGS